MTKSGRAHHIVKWTMGHSAFATEPGSLWRQMGRIRAGLRLLKTPFGVMPFGSWASTNRIKITKHDREYWLELTMIIKSGDQGFGKQPGMADLRCERIETIGYVGRRWHLAKPLHY